MMHYLLILLTTFTVGFDAEFPPYGFKEGDTYKGFDLDLARAVCERRGWDFVPNPINWDTKDMELNSGSIDCIWNGFTIQGRETAYTWSKPYVDNSQVVLVLADSPVKTLADLKGQVVAVQTDTPVQKALSKGGDQAALGETFRELVVEPSYNQAVYDLKSKAVNAVALDIGVARQKCRDLPGVFRILDETVMTENYGIGFKLGNTNLASVIEAELAVLRTNGVMKALAEKYAIDGMLSPKEADEAMAKLQAKIAEMNAVSAPLDWKDMMTELLMGFLTTLAIFFMTLVIALPLGFPIAFARMSRNPVLKSIASVYISIVRGTPLMLQIIFVYFAPYIFFGLPLMSYPRLLATILAFGLNYAAYFAEIYRAGIQSVPESQWEAAASLGATRKTAFYKVVLPQVIRNVIPALGNEVITLVKDTSLAFTIGVAEMFTMAKQYSAAHTSMMPLIVAGLFYYIFNYVVAWAIDFTEKRMNRGGKAR